MEQFYTKQVSEEIFKTLLSKHYPAENIPVGYFTFAEGGGYPEYARKVPTYAEVLDWLKGLGFFISIHETINQGFVVTSFDYDQCECSPHCRVGNTLIEALDQLILFALEFIHDDYS